MTNSAKQDTAKTAAAATETKPAEQESAATEADVAATTDTVTPEPADEAETDPAEEPATPDLDETKRKFRAALERKNHAHSDSQGASGRDGSKVSNAHGPASSKRNFRRKSG